MRPEPHETVTELLGKLRAGDRDAVEILFDRVYDTLRDLARKERQNLRGDLTLNTTALVHEAYLKLVDGERPSLTSRAHFLNVAAKVMRHVLVDYARARRAQKRGGDALDLSIDDVLELPFDGPAIDDNRVLDLIELDRALSRLAKIDPREAHVVECRFFAGMTIEQTALALDVSAMTVKRDWNMALAWLRREMTGGASE